MHELALPLLIGLIVLALAFDFLNGLHDAANSIATVVATKLLGPVQAVAFAAFFNFAAYFLTLALPQLHKVADTIGKGLIDKDLVTPAVVFGALVGAMFWNVVTWLKGHSLLVQPRAGRRDRRRRRRPCRPDRRPVDRLNKTLIAIVLSPTLGMILSMLIMLVSSWLLVRASAQGRADVPLAAPRLLGRLFAQPRPQRRAEDDGDHHRPALFDRLSDRRFRGAALGRDQLLHRDRLGTLMGGWRIIETMGSRITKLSQHQGFSASMGGSIMLFTATLLGIPVSTTHTITGCVIGAGVARRASAVRWGVARNVVMNI